MSALSLDNTDWYVIVTIVETNTVNQTQKGELNMISVYDFVFLMTEDSAKISVYDLTKNKEVFCGEAGDARWEFAEYEVQSIDVDPTDSRGAVLVLNIESEDM